MLSAIFALILTLFLVVGIHEAGHALAAYWSGIKIQRISIGFGKSLFVWKLQSQIELVWSLWPLGGYVQLLDTRNSALENLSSRSFNKAPFRKRFFVLIAGALANWLLAFLALLLFFVIGTRFLPAIAPEVLPNSPVAIAGLAQGVRIIDIAKQPTGSWREVIMVLLLNLGEKEVGLHFQDNKGDLHSGSLDLSQNARKGASLMAFLGFKEDKKVKPITAYQAGLPWLQALRNAWALICHLIIFYIIMIKKTILGQIPLSWLLGPFAIAMVTVKSFMQGLASYLFFIANLSLSIGLVNLLPIPGLDGGSIVYAILEKIRGKPLSLAWEVLLYRLSLIVFFMFFMHLLMNDLNQR